MQAKSTTQKSHLHSRECEGMNPHIPKWIWNSQLGSPKTKWHLDVAPMANDKEYYKGKGDSWVSPKFELWWTLWIHVCSCSFVHQKCSNHTLTNLLFGLCRFVWIIDPLFTHLSPHLKVLARPFALKVLWTKSIPQFLFLLFSLSNSHLSLPRNVGVHQSHIEGKMCSTTY